MWVDCMLETGWMGGACENRLERGLASLEASITLFITLSPAREQPIRLHLTGPVSCLREGPQGCVYVPGYFGHSGATRCSSPHSVASRHELQQPIMSPMRSSPRSFPYPARKASFVVSVLWLLLHLSLVAHGFSPGSVIRGPRASPGCPSASSPPPPGRALRRVRGNIYVEVSSTAYPGTSGTRGGSSTPPLPASSGVRGDPVTVQQVFICTSRWCMQRGAGATMGSFIGLTPYGSKVRVQGVDCLGRCNRGPNLRLLRSNGTFEELSYVDSVDKASKWRGNEGLGCGRRVYVLGCQ